MVMVHRTIFYAFTGPEQYNSVYDEEERVSRKADKGQSRKGLFPGAIAPKEGLARTLASLLLCVFA
jgi:hypothetical protein